MTSNNRKRSADSKDGPTPQEYDNLSDRRPCKKIKPSSFECKQNDKNDDNGIINTLTMMGFSKGLIQYVLDENPNTKDPNILVTLCFHNQDYYNKFGTIINNNHNNQCIQHNNNSNQATKQELRKNGDDKGLKSKSENELLKLEYERMKLENEKLKMKVAASNYIIKWELEVDGNKWMSYNEQTSHKIEELSNNESFTFKSSHNGQNYKITKINDTTGTQQNIKSHYNRKIRQIKKDKKDEILALQQEKQKLMKEMDEAKYIYKWERKSDKNAEWILYDMKTSQKVDNLGINESFTFISPYNNKKYEIMKMDQDTAYQMNVETKCKRNIRRRKLCKDDAILKAEEEKDRIMEAANKEIFVFEWKWKNEHNKWIPYNKEINKGIEELKGKNEYGFTFNNTIYKIRRISDDKAFQFNTKTKYERHVKCIRKRVKDILHEAELEKNKLIIQYPIWWNKNTLRKPGKSYDKAQIIKMDINDEKSKEIINKFYATSRDDNQYKNKYSNIKIIGIESVENQRLFDKYWNERNILSKTVNNINERYLWHGTGKEDIMSLIETEGFRKEFNSKAMWGKGTYFAINAGYSVAYSSKNNNGINKMFLCLVLCGESKLGNNKYELKSWPKKHNKLIYDSLISKEKNIYVIHDDVRAYPMFVISFTTN